MRACCHHSLQATVSVLKLPHGRIIRDVDGFFPETTLKSLSEVTVKLDVACIAMNSLRVYCYPLVQYWLA
jgi:hypothetical protein